MSMERRIGRLEDGLPPGPAVIAWLDEAHGFGSLADHVRWLVDRPAGEAPLVRLGASVVSGVRRAMKGRPPERILEGEERAELELAFLFELALRLEVATQDLLRTAGLRYGLLYWQQRALGHEAVQGDDGLAGTRQRILAHAVDWRDGVSALLLEMDVAAGARRLLEARHLHGQDCAFPDTRARWERLRVAVEDLAGIADVIGVLVRRTLGPDADIGGPIDVDALRLRAGPLASERADRMGEVVHAEALELVGDLGPAAAIIARHLRASP